MSDYGADSPPELTIAWDLIHTKKLITGDKVNAMEWTYLNRIVCKLARRQDHSNILIKVET